MENVCDIILAVVYKLPVHAFTLICPVYSFDPGLPKPSDPGIGGGKCTKRYGEGYA